MMDQYCKILTCMIVMFYFNFQVILVTKYLSVFIRKLVFIITIASISLSTVMYQ